MMKARLLLLILPTALLCVCGCVAGPDDAGPGNGGVRHDQATAESGLRLVRIVVGGVPLEVEVADTDERRTMGYMHRERPEQGGMLFVFERERYRSFWMKNVSFDIDIAFINAAGRIEQIERMYAWRLDSVPSRRPAKYALEVPSGWFAEQGVEAGDMAEIPPDIAAQN